MQKLKQLNTRLLAVLLMILVAGGSLVVPIVAEARPADATGNVQQRIEQLMGRFPDGSHFTVNGVACAHAHTSPCRNCSLHGVMID